MAKNHIQSDQIIHNAALSELAPSGDTELLALLPAINSRLTDPLSLSASGLVLTVGSSIVTIGPDGKKRGTPQLDSVDLGNINGTFSFVNGPGGAVIVTGDAVVATIPSVTTSYFVRAGIEVRSDKKVYVVFGAEGASAATAGAPGFSEGVLQCGEFLLEEDGAGGFVVPADQSGVTQFGTGSGGGGSGTGLGNINYVTNFKGDIDTNGWTTYYDGAVSAPVDGIGGTVDPGFTLTKTDVDPLRGKGCFLITKGASDLQGHGVSTDLKLIDVADRGRIMEITFDYEGSAGYDGQIQVFAYNMDASSVIPMIGLRGIDQLKGRAKYRFVAPTGTADEIRLIFHVFTPSTTAFTLKFDLVSVGPVFETDQIKRTISQSSAHGLFAYDVVSFTGTTWSRAQATPANYKPEGVIGLVLEVIDTHRFVLLEKGYFSIPAPQNLNGGSTYYLSETAGDYTTDEGQQVKVELFRAINQAEAIWDPHPAERYETNPSTGFFPLRFTTGNVVQFKGGAFRVDDGVPIFSDNATAELTDHNFTLDLDGVLASPTDNTTYWLYIDRYALAAPAAFTDTGRLAQLAYSTSHFVLSTDAPNLADPYRYIEVCAFHTADSGNTWNGTGSRFTTRVEKSHQTGLNLFSHPEQKTVTLTTSTTSTVAHGLSGVPNAVQAFYYDGTNEAPVDASAHVSNADDTNITVSSVGLTFGAGEYLRVVAFYNPESWNTVASVRNQVEDGWYTDTSVTSFPHNLPDASWLRGSTVIEHDVTAGTYRHISMPQSPITGYDDTTVYLDWTGFSPSANLQYKVIFGGHPLPSAVQREIGGFTKFVGFGPGSYATLAAAVAAAQPGDSILVNRSESISAAVDVNVDGVKVVFMPNVKLTVTGGTKGIILSGNDIQLENAWVVADFAGTLTAGIEVTGDDCDVDRCKVEANDAGVTITDAYLLSSGAQRNGLYAKALATAGAITNGLTDNSGNATNDYAIRA